MKILVVKNSLTVTIEDDVQKAFSYLQEQTKQRGFELPFTIEYIETDIEMNYVFFKSHNGKRLYGSSGTKEKLRAVVKDNTYDIVIFAYQSNNTYKDGYLTSWTFWQGLYDKTEYVELLVNKTNDRSGWVWKSIIHETLHAICRIAIKKEFSVVDEMDYTFYPGKIVEYAYNDDPYHPDGNHSHTLDNLAPFLSKLNGVQTSKEWEHFTSAADKKRIEGVVDEVMDRLVVARKISGVPMIITSGKRTVERNKLVGGVPDSTHLSGEAVDIACSVKDINKLVKLVYGFGRAGFPFVKVSNNHIHVDISKKRPDQAYYDGTDD